MARLLSVCLLLSACFRPTLDRDCACVLGDRCVPLGAELPGRIPNNGSVIAATADGAFILVEHEMGRTVLDFSSGSEVEELRNARALAGHGDSLIAILDSEIRQLRHGVLDVSASSRMEVVRTAGPAFSLAGIVQTDDGRREVTTGIGTGAALAPCPGLCNPAFVTYLSQDDVVFEALPVGTLDPKTTISSSGTTTDQPSATWDGHCRPLATTANGLIAACVRPSRLALNNDTTINTDVASRLAFATTRRVGWVRTTEQRVEVLTLELDALNEPPIISSAGDVQVAVGIQSVIGTTQGPLILSNSRQDGTQVAVQLHCMGREYED